MIKNNNKPAPSPNQKGVNIDMVATINKGKKETPDKKETLSSPQFFGGDEKQKYINDLKAFGASFENRDDWLYCCKSSEFLKMIDNGNFVEAKQYAKRFYCKIRD